ncbi:MAG: hypothetical protein ACRDKW_17590 [Actinomycetota bacterium]
MEAYAAPFCAALLAGLLATLSLGLVGLVRRRRDRTRPATGPAPGAARDAAITTADPLLLKLSFRLLAVALFLGFCGLFLFARATPEGGAALRPDVWTFVALLGAWVVGVVE